MKRCLAIVLILYFLILCGCSNEVDSSGQRLQLSAVTDLEMQTQIINDISYVNIKDVHITIDGKTHALHNAIAEDMITVEEIMAYARIDARNGYCSEITTSHNGLSHYIYRYPGICDLYFIHDVYETPDGQNHHIERFLVLNPLGADSIHVGVSEPWSVIDKNYPIDQEDWKLEFQTTDVSSSGFTLIVEQSTNGTGSSKSQHIGQLYLSNFDLYNLETLECHSFTFKQNKYPISPNTSISVAVNFSDQDHFPPTLPSGSYRMWLGIYDQFDDTDIHPLMRDYHDFQGYWIDIKIP